VGLSLSSHRPRGKPGRFAARAKSETWRLRSVFFSKPSCVVGYTPEQVTTDGHTSYPRAIREIMGDMVQHRTNTHLNHALEQDHRAIKQRYYPIHGLGNFVSASRFCRAFDEVRQFFRMRSSRKQRVSLTQQREAFCHQLNA